MNPIAEETMSPEDGRSAIFFTKTFACLSPRYLEKWYRYSSNARRYQHSKKTKPEDVKKLSKKNKKSKTVQSGSNGGITVTFASLNPLEAWYTQAREFLGHGFEPQNQPFSVSFGRKPRHQRPTMQPGTPVRKWRKSLNIIKVPFSDVVQLKSKFLRQKNQIGGKYFSVKKCLCVLQKSLQENQ